MVTRNGHDAGTDATVRDLRTQIVCLTARLDESRRFIALITGSDPFGVLTNDQKDQQS